MKAKDDNRWLMNQSFFKKILVGNGQLKELYYTDLFHEIFSGDDMKVAWLPWVTSKDRKDFVYAGRYAQILPLGNLRVPLINRIPYWRLSHYNFTLPVELKLLEWMLKKLNQRDSMLSRAMRRFLPYIGYRKGSFRK